MANKKNSIVMPSIVLIILGLLIAYFSYSSLRGGFISDSALMRHTGQIIQKGIITETSNLVRDPETGLRERTTQKFFSMKLAGLPQKLSYYNLEESYGELENLLSETDIVTVHYELPDNPTYGLSIYGIEKNGQIILDSSGNRLRKKIFGFVAAIVAILAFAKATQLLVKKQ